MASEDGWQRVSSAVRARRGESGMSLEQIASVSGVSKATWAKIENAQQQHYWSSVIAKIESVLGWERGSIDRIRDGGTPVMRPVGTPTVGSPQALLAALSELTDAELAAVEGFARQLVRGRGHSGSASMYPSDKVL